MEYVCDICDLPIGGDDPHTNDETGGDVHEACCPTCHPELKEEKPESGTCVVCAIVTTRRVPGARTLFACGYHGGKPEESDEERRRRLQAVYTQPRNPRGALSHEGTRPARQQPEDRGAGGGDRGAARA